MSEPKVSIIIPCYNQGHLVDEAVDSVLVQTFDDFEIIIVNDGSTSEETNHILAEYSRPKTKVIHTDNQGLAAARNNGIKAAQGKYILPLDADDKIGRTYLEKAVYVLDENPDIGIVYCRARLFGEMDSEWVLPDFSMKEMLFDNIIFCSSFFRREDWESVGGFDSAMEYGWEDYDFWLSLIERGKMVYRIPEILFYYRITADSMVRSKEKKQKVETFTKIFHKHTNLFTQQIDIWLDYIIGSREEYFVAKLYIDTGDGFNEAQTLTQKLDLRARSIIFDLSGFTGLENLRFDPIDDYCVLNLNTAVLTTEAGESVELDAGLRNTTDKDKSNLVFTDNDPHLIFNLPTGDFERNLFKSFSVSFEFLAIGEEAFFHLLKRKNGEVQVEKEHVRHLEKELDRVVNSLTWKEIGVLILKKTKLAVKRLKCRLNKDFRAVEQSGLFDSDYYFARNKDLDPILLDPLIHYFEHGHREGRNPNPLFSTSWYWYAYPEVAKTEQNPLAHYVRQGYLEGKNPCPMFETAYYLLESPEIKTAGLNPLKHYLDIGYKEGLKPNPLFDSTYYLDHNPEVRDAGINPLAHYIEKGVCEGRLPHAPQETFLYTPLISIVTPVYNVDEKYLRCCIDSVLNQAYENWEFCLVDDGSSKPHVRSVLNEYANCDQRIKVKFLLENQGIAQATNEGVELSSGSYIGFLDNDDELTRDALLEMVRSLNENKVDLLYSDECFIDANGDFQDAHHKPDFSADLLLCHNYITHFCVMRRELFEQAGGLSDECNGAQDFDLVLKVTERTEKIKHIPKILYRWRTLETSTSADPGAKSYADDAGMIALRHALQRRRISGAVYQGNLPFYYRVKREIVDKPLVTIIIPFCDQPEYLRRCAESIRQRTQYPNYEVIGISNNSRQDETFQLMKSIEKRDSHFKFIEYNKPFNYSEINNFGVRHAQGEHIVFMNNDIEVLDNDWLEALLEHSQRSEVGAVGAKLYYEDDTIQHAGIIIGIGGFAGHSHRFISKKSPGYFNRLNCIQNVSAVTAALLMVKKVLFDEVGGLDEENFGVALNDVDFCLKLRDKGYVNIFTPYCKARHYESVSRGYEDTPQKKKRFGREVKHFKEKWSGILAQGDPYYNPNLTLIGENFARNKYIAWFSSEEQRKEYLN